MNRPSLLKRSIRKFVPWKCWQCGEKSDLGERKYDRWVTQEGTKEKKRVPVCIHCYNKREWW